MLLVDSNATSLSTLYVVVVDLALSCCLGSRIIWSGRVALNFEVQSQAL